MDDLTLVRGRDAFADLLEPPRRHRAGQTPAAIELVPQRPSLHELHHQERAVGADGAEVEDGDDVRMRQPRAGLGFAFESPQRLAIAERRGPA